MLAPASIESLAIQPSADLLSVLQAVVYQICVVLKNGILFILIVHSNQKELA